MAKKIKDAKKNNEPIPTELPDKTITSIERSVKLSQAQKKLVIKLTFELESESPKVLKKTFEVIEYLKDTATLVEGVHFNLNSMIKYISNNDELKPSEIGQKYLNTFGSSDSTDMFLNEKQAPDALPKLYKLKNIEPVDFFKLFSSEFLKVMDEYTTDLYFEMLQQFETQFSDKDFETITTLLSENKLSGQKIGTLANKFYIDGPDAARNFLNSL